MSTPHSPANKPIAQQRVVRGDAVLRLPGSVVGPDLPRFSKGGVVSAVAESPPWVMEADAVWTECAVGFLVVDAIEFDIKVNGSVIESIVCGAGSPQLFLITVPVERDDEITIEITDFDSGLAEDVSWCLRHALPGA